MNTAVLFSSSRDDWQTPPDLFAQLDAEFDFDVDAAASIDNALCQYFWGPGGDPRLEDALTVDWANATPMLGRPPVCWLNPPYSRGLQHKFIAKAYNEAIKGVTTVMLLPARTDTRAFHRFILPFSGINSSSHGLAWLAGIIDGEGSIGIYPGGNGDGKSHYLRLTVVNTDLPMLEKAKTITRLGAVRESRPAGDGRKQIWVWECNSAAAAGVLSAVYPFLLTKQRQAQMALEFFHGPRMPWEAQLVVGEALSEAKRLQSRPGVRVEVRFLPGRIKFVGAKHGAPFPSMIIVFRGER